MGVISATLIIATNVLMRYVFDIGLIWAEESVRFIIIWVTFVGASLCIRNNIHVKVDVLHLKLPFKYEKMLICFIYLVCIVFCIFLAYTGGILTYRVFATGQFNTSMPWLRMWMVNLSIPVFGVLGTKDFIQLFVLNLIRKGEIVRTVGGGNK